MFAVIRTGGKQYRVQPGQILLVEKVGPAEGSHAFSDVLLVADEATGVKVGRPTVPGASVAATVLGEQRARKIVVFKKKKRKGYRRKNGHRQTFARVRIDSINA